MNQKNKKTSNNYNNNTCRVSDILEKGQRFVLSQSEPKIENKYTRNNSIKPPKTLLKTKDAAELLGISTTTLLLWRKDGIIKTITKVRSGKSRGIIFWPISEIQRVSNFDN